MLAMVPLVLLLLLLLLLVLALTPDVIVGWGEQRLEYLCGFGVCQMTSTSWERRGDRGEGKRPTNTVVMILIHHTVIIAVTKNFPQTLQFHHPSRSPSKGIILHG